MNKSIRKDYLISQYDEIANRYDGLFMDKESLEENKEVSNLLKVYKGSVYEIGCGTGLFLELCNIEPQDYLGIDPSEGMLKQLKKKHPQYTDRIIQTTFEREERFYKDYDNIISLFGSISYVDKECLRKIGESGKDYFLMFYKNGYRPVTYEKTNVDFVHNETDIFFLKEVLSTATLIEFNNYLIAKSK